MSSSEESLDVMFWNVQLFLIVIITRYSFSDYLVFFFLLDDHMYRTYIPCTCRNYLMVNMKLGEM